MRQMPDRARILAMRGSPFLSIPFGAGPISDGVFESGFKKMRGFSKTRFSVSGTFSRLFGISKARFRVLGKFLRLFESQVLSRRAIAAHIVVCSGSSFLVAGLFGIFPRLFGAGALFAEKRTFRGSNKRRNVPKTRNLLGNSPNKRQFVPCMVFSSTTVRKPCRVGRWRQKAVARWPVAAGSHDAFANGGRKPWRVGRQRAMATRALPIATAREATRALPNHVPRAAVRSLPARLFMG